VYIFLEKFHGKSSLSKAIHNQAVANGRIAFHLDGTVGSSANQLRTLEQRSDAAVIVDGLPEATANRITFLNRFNSLKGHAILFATPEYLTDASLNPDISRVWVGHVDGRPTDKLAWLIGLIREYLRDDTGALQEPMSEALRKMPVKTLVTLSAAPLGPKVSGISDLARRIAEAIQLRVNLQLREPFPGEELAAIFIDFYSRGASDLASGFRLWVEGDSDCRILKLVSKLVAQVHGINLEEGLSILPLGEGRGGGTSEAVDVVLANRTRRNRDVFLFDLDEPGRHAQEKLQNLGQDAVLLDSSIACSRAEQEVEIEDFISLSCLDRFYGHHTDLRPEKEVIKYKAPASRRLGPTTQ
jgi:hypothetical protein